MSYATLILGESGTGKTCSLRNLDPAKTLLIQPIRKPLPFRAKGWKEIVKKGAPGNVFVTDDPGLIMATMIKAPHEIIVVDDYQYILANLYMAKRNVKGYDKFTEIGGAGFDIAKLASELAPEKRVYVLAHTTTDDFGNTRIKTLGRLLDEKIVVEGLFTTVLRTMVDAGRYYFLTQNNGHDTVKSPLGMFDEDLIPNDLAEVDETIRKFYEIQEPNESNNSETKESTK